eukprot:CAMPEP_0113650764 /NCGR_PEP_ID=MMETSP0017_2-20120614/27035_1 /TAXON_ID=2856 /ORGANISM="Cylindrotheca closterium" /LENGTH=126 /DNA_ID=CAMNT_0000563343 /DNA_START=53 /DNA_END=430 /DNA_ORIENTATION=+ /assembly_acc=CAM_ASM_000147
MRNLKEHRSRSEGNLSVVSFGSVEVQEHAMVLGNNPSTSVGPSVELDWDSQSNVTFDTVDDYESHRVYRRSTEQLVMPSCMRVKLLLDNGFTFPEIREETRKRRKKVMALPMMKQAANVLKRFSGW